MGARGRRRVGRVGRRRAGHRGGVRRRGDGVGRRSRDRGPHVPRHPPRRRIERAAGAPARGRAGREPGDELAERAGRRPARARDRLPGRARVRRAGRRLAARGAPARRPHRLVARRRRVVPGVCGGRSRRRAQLGVPAGCDGTPAAVHTRRAGRRLRLRRRRGCRPAVRVLALAQRVLRRDCTPRATRALAALARRRAELLDADRPPGRRRLCDHERGGHDRGRPRHVVDRTVRVDGRPAARLGRCGGDTGARGRLDAAAVVDLAHGGPDSRDRGLRRSPRRAGGALRAVSCRRDAGGARTPLRRHSPVPGESAVASLRRAGGRPADRPPRLGRSRGDDGRWPRGRAAHRGQRIRCDALRAGRGGDAPGGRRVAARARRRRSVRLRVGGARLRPRPRARRRSRRVRGRAVRRCGRGSRSPRRRRRRQRRLRRRRPRLGRAAGRLDARPRRRRGRRRGARCARRRPRCWSTATDPRCSPARAATRAPGSATGPSWRRRCLRVGRSAEACEFVRWYAPHQAADGNVPCVVDRTGPDWLPEHDSHGQLDLRRRRVLPLHARPRIPRRAVAGRAAQGRRLSGDAARDPPRRRVRHAGAARAPRPAARVGEPRGLPRASRARLLGRFLGAAAAIVDAAAIAARLGDRCGGASLRRRGADMHRACTRLDRADHRDTKRSTTCPARSSGRTSTRRRRPSPSPCSTAAGRLPRGALASRRSTSTSTASAARRDGEIDWNNYTAYEIRILGALRAARPARRGARAAGLLPRDRRPRAWNQWPEITWRDPRSPGSPRRRAAHLDRRRVRARAPRACWSSSVPPTRRWSLRRVFPQGGCAGGAEVALAGLPTYYGTLGLRLRRAGEHALAVTLSGALDVPPGGIVLCPPLDRALAAVEVDGRPIGTFDAESATIATCPAEVVLRLGALPGHG